MTQIQRGKGENIIKRKHDKDKEIKEIRGKKWKYIDLKQYKTKQIK